MKNQPNLSPEHIARISIMNALLIRAAAVGSKVTTPAQARQALLEAADILAKEPSQAAFVEKLRTGACDLGDELALRLCRHMTASFTEQVNASLAVLEKRGEMKQFAKKPWWKVW